MKHNILNKVKSFCEKESIGFRLEENGLDLRLLKIFKSEGSGYRGLNKSNGKEIRLNTQNEIITYISYHYKKNIYN